MGRALGILGVGLVFAIGIGAMITPAGGAGGFLLLLAVVALGLLITVIAGFKGKKADADRELAEQSRLLGRQDT